MHNGAGSNRASSRGGCIDLDAGIGGRSGLLWGCGRMRQRAVRRRIINRRGWSSITAACVRGAAGAGNHGLRQIIGSVQSRLHLRRLQRFGRRKHAKLHNQRLVRRGRETSRNVAEGQCCIRNRATSNGDLCRQINSTKLCI